MADAVRDTSILPEHPQFQNKCLTKSTCTPHPMQGVGHMSGSWCFQGHLVPGRREKQRINHPASFLLGGATARYVLLCLQACPVELCLSCPPRNLLMNALRLTPFPFLSHLPILLQCAPRPPPKLIPCPPSYSSQVQFRVTHLWSEAGISILLATHLGCRRAKA